MTETLLKTVLDVSEQMVEARAEIHRVEEGLTRLCAAYGAVRADVYATTRTLMVSAECADGRVITQTCGILHSGTDIEKLDHDIAAFAARAFYTLELTVALSLGIVLVTASTKYLTALVRRHITAK